jgi:hypothetical protein
LYTHPEAEFVDALDATRMHDVEPPAVVLSGDRGGGQEREIPRRLQVATDQVAGRFEQTSAAIYNLLLRNAGLGEASSDEDGSSDETMGVITGIPDALYLPTNDPAAPMAPTDNLLSMAVAWPALPGTTLLLRLNGATLTSEAVIKACVDTLEWHLLFHLACEAQLEYDRASDVSASDGDLGLPSLDWLQANVDMPEGLPEAMDPVLNPSLFSVSLEGHYLSPESRLEDYGFSPQDILMVVQMGKGPSYPHYKERRMHPAKVASHAAKKLRKLTAASKDNSQLVDFSSNQDTGDRDFARSGAIRPFSAPTLGGLAAYGYVCDPPIEELRSMAPEALAKVLNFSVAREGYGAVMWVGECDVRSLRLDRIVRIDENGVAVYASGEGDDDDAGLDPLPPVGRSLNREAIVVVQNYFPYEGQSEEHFYKHLYHYNQRIKSKGGELEYNDEEGFLILKLPDFSPPVVDEDQSSVDTNSFVLDTTAGSFSVSIFSS